MIAGLQSGPSDMGAYQHVLVVMSIVLGLAITELLKGAAQLYRNRQNVRSYWLYWAWTILLLFFIMLLWWTYWNYRTITEWDFLRFVIYLSPAVAFFFLTAITFPAPSEGAVDLRAFYFSNRTGFFETFAIYIFLGGLTAVVVRGLPLLDGSNGFRLATIVLLLIAMRSANERVHAAIFIISAALMVVFIALFQFRLA